ncbi:LOW QUALITY PROTEIN: hypothetical protein PanWU01x14_265430 [Parasponia andersonii]|uniref:Uncharacterized protein n=1 Tax=Parasponia andersonii TaxID=3476 RepID=A0A2P5B799_PARAD|nr:LOW QUALITY PROTEIN: hypothetical protein PanWU01x14_265430 [Parasponia andersonii]
MEPAAEGHQLRVEALGIEGFSRKWSLISDDQIGKKGGEKRLKRQTSRDKTTAPNQYGGFWRWEDEVANSTGARLTYKR